MMMGLAIAHHIREQVVFTNEPIIMPSRYSFNIERQNETQYDWGEEITIV
jgi:hypothetical protein